MKLSRTGKILVFGGCYSNRQATEALLAEAARRGIPTTHMFSLGDIVAYGADAAATLHLIRGAGIAGIAGNCEVQLAAAAADCNCGFTPGSACDELAASWYAHASLQLSAADRAALAAFPEQIRLDLDGRSLLLVHGNVERINAFVFPSASNLEIARQLDLSDCDAVFAGHSGIPFTRRLGAKTWHNPGSIGLPANDGTPRGWFSTVQVSGGRLQIESHALDYDFVSAAMAMRRARLPEGYAEALASGIWPSLDVLPWADRARTGIPLEDTPQAEPVSRQKLERLETLWINTGTLCNLSCIGCFMESSPDNDSLAYFSLRFLNEILATSTVELQEIGFTGGEPFMHPDILPMLEAVLATGRRVLVLTNAMRPMQRHAAALAALLRRWPDQLAIRVSLDHFLPEKHDALRGRQAFTGAIAGLKLLAEAGVKISVAARTPWGESEVVMRQGFAALFAAQGIPLDAQAPHDLVLFPEIDVASPVPEVTHTALAALSPERKLMCATSRMVVQRRGALSPDFTPCTLLPDRSLPQIDVSIPLDHPHCAQFCVYGRASCAGV